MGFTRAVVTETSRIKPAQEGQAIEVDGSRWMARGGAARGPVDAPENP